MYVQEESVLAIGSGPILLLLAESWMEFGLPNFSVIVTGSQPTDTTKLMKPWERALRDDPDAGLNMHVTAEDGDPDWGTVVRPYSLILYVSQNGDLEELRKIQHACMEAKKSMLPAVFIGGKGLVGPLLLPDGAGDWDSAWRRIHSTVFAENSPESISATAIAMLSDILVHEGRKAAIGEEELNCRDQCFILNPVMLTGSWHRIHAHPPVTGHQAIRPVNHIELAVSSGRAPEGHDDWFACLTRWTSPVTGIFHIWEEADLIQLPLAQCLIQPIDPLSPGPASLMPIIVRSGLTHEEARRESGLAGLEAYAERLLPQLVSGSRLYPYERIGIGAGFTVAEAVGRGIRACLIKQWRKRSNSDRQSVTRLTCTQVQDVRCRFYLQALGIIDGEPLIAAGEPLLGFPVAWVYSDSSWYGSVDISFTLALRRSLQMALEKTDRAVPFDAVRFNHGSQDITIPDSESATYASLVRSAIDHLEQINKRIKVLDMRSESFCGEEPLFIYGVMLGEEGSS